MQYLLVAVYLLLALNIQSNATELYSPSVPLMFSCSNMHGHLKTVLRQNPGKNLVFFVHGRGKYPDKAYDLLPKFEEKYKVVSLTFIWDAWSHWFSRPVDNAINTAPRLMSCLEEFQKFKNTERELLKDRQTIFILHSMGNIILREMLQTYDLSHLDYDLFDTVILNSADVPSKSHGDWLKKLNISKKAYITMNGDDIVLAASNLIDVTIFGTRRLGSYFEDPVPLESSYSSTEFLYLDFDKLSFLGHRHFFVQNEETKERVVTRIYKHLIQGTGDFPTEYQISPQYPNLYIFMPR